MNKKDIFIGLFAAFLLVVISSLFASSFPDGLERVAADKLFLEKKQGNPAIVAPIPDYAWPNIKSEKMATFAGGVFGILIVFGGAYGFAALLKRNARA